MSKTACSCMRLEIGKKVVNVAVFVNGTTYEIYFGYFKEDSSEVGKRYPSLFI